MIEQVVNWVVEMIGHLGYPGIVFLMFLESSCFPFPSEVVMIPAGYLAYQGEMNFWMAVLMGVLGSWLGALFNYFLAWRLGRPLLLKYGKYFFISAENFQKGERFFNKHGEISTFTGRLIPVIRQYISLPAGLVRMNLSHFLLFTGLGSSIWMAVLTYIGYVAGQNEDLWRPMLKEATVWALLACVLILALYLVFHWRKRRRQPDYPVDSRP